MTIRRALPTLFLAALLWLAATLATNLTALRVLDLPIQAAAMLALSALLLDLAARFRAHGLYGQLALAGVHGLAAVILFEPSVNAAGLPRLLVTHGLGAQTLVGLLMLTLWLTALSGRQSAQAIGAAAVTGAVGFVWARGMPPIPSLILAVVMIVLAVGFYGLTTRATPGPEPVDLSLPWRGQAIAALILGAIAAYRLSSGALDPLTLAMAAFLIVFVVVLLWFQRSKRTVSLLETALPPAPPRPIFLLVPVALILGAGLGAILTPNLQLRDGLDAVVTAFGIVWLPAMSFAIGARAMLRQVRAQQL